MKLSPKLTNPQQNPNVAWQNSWFQVSNDQGVPLYGNAVYNVNQLGANGFTVLTGTSPLTGNFAGLQTTSTSNTVSLSTSSGINSNFSLPIAGFTLQTPFTGIQLSTGSALVFFA